MYFVSQICFNLLINSSIVICFTLCNKYHIEQLKIAENLQVQCTLMTVIIAYVISMVTFYLFPSSSSDQNISDGD